MTERRDIGSRLENWARVYRDTYRPGVSGTSVFIDHVKRERLGEPPGRDRRSADAEDAAHVEAGMVRLKLMGLPQRRARELLIRCYIDGEHPGEVCREMRIPHRPRSAFVDAFRDAQDAIARELEPRHTFHDA